MRKQALALIAVLALSSCVGLAAAEIEPACKIDPQLSASPPETYSLLLLAGSGFHWNSEILLTFDDAVVASYPLTVKTDFDGAFSCLVVAPNSTDVGVHTVTALDSYGNMASIEVTLLDSKGVAGKDGINGTDGLDGRDGLDGVNGADGKDGANGKDGLNGIGTQGPKGDTGAQGQTGAQGTAGANGKNGADGIDGKTIETHYNPSIVTNDIAFLLSIGCVLALAVFASVVVLVVKKKL